MPAKLNMTAEEILERNRTNAAERSRRLREKKKLAGVVSIEIDQVTTIALNQAGDWSIMPNGAPAGIGYMHEYPATNLGIHDLAISLIGLRDAYVTVQKSRAEMRAQHQENIDQFNAHIADLIEEKRVLATELDGQIAQRVELDGQIAELTNEKRVLATELDGQIAQRAELEGQIAEMINETQALRAEIDALQRPTRKKRSAQRPKAIAATIPDLVQDLPLSSASV